MATTVDGQVSVRQIARTFASGKKAENLVYSSLADGGFPSGKVSKCGFRLSQTMIYLSMSNFIVTFLFNQNVHEFYIAYKVAQNFPINLGLSY